MTLEVWFGTEKKEKKNKKINLRKYYIFNFLVKKISYLKQNYYLFYAKSNPRHTVRFFESDTQCWHGGFSAQNLKYSLMSLHRVENYASDSKKTHCICKRLQNRICPSNFIFFMYHEKPHLNIQRLTDSSLRYSLCRQLLRGDSPRQSSIFSAK